jgi:RimJ/RimL family protein N-acetyltransferase
MAEPEAKSVPFINGTEIYLCPPNTEHLNLYTRWINAPKIRKYVRNEIPQNSERVKKMFEPTQERFRSDIYFEIWHKADKKPIGYGGLNRIRWFDRSAFLFYIIGETEYWGKVIATEAAKLIRDYGFTELNLNKINATIYAPNHASIRIIERIGFQFELCLRKEIFIDGEHVDALKYSILKKEWQDLKSDS